MYSQVEFKSGFQLKGNFDPATLGQFPTHCKDTTNLTEDEEHDYQI